tara:strand:+ start:1014 stop:1142 length:129 start_codon:yes stop_codon:yes gene_type:complete
MIFEAAFAGIANPIPIEPELTRSYNSCVNTDYLTFHIKQRST